MITALQMRILPREPRHPVLLPCQVRVGSQPIAACIHNISSRGILAAADQAPAPGSYVDIRRGRHLIIGRVVWRKGRVFGVRTQDRLDIAGLSASTDKQSGGAPALSGGAAARLVAEGKLARQAEQSRQLATGLQFFILTLVAIGAALFVAIEVYGLLAAPVEAIGNAMVTAN